MLKRAKLTLKFANDYIESMIAAKRLRQSGRAFLISLNDADTVLKQVGSSPQSNLATPLGVETNSAEKSAGDTCASVKIVQSATAEGTSASQVEGSTQHLPERAGRSRRARHSDTHDDDIGDRSDSKERLTTEFVHTCNYQCCTALHADINVYTATTHADAAAIDGAVESSAIESWINAEPQEAPLDAEGGAEPAKAPALRDRSGSDLLIPRETANTLNKRYASRAWFVTAGFIQRLHLLRHAPAGRMEEFLTMVVPLKAKQRNTPEFRRWKAAVSAYCAHVVRACASCCAHGPTIRRLAGIGVPAAFTLGRADIFVLDHNLRLCALCVIDSGTGYCIMAVIDSCPPTGPSVYECYVRFWASFFGFHETVLTDPDGLFRGANLNYRESSGCTMGEVGAGAHFSQGQVENRI